MLTKSQMKAALRDACEDAGHGYEYIEGSHPRALVDIDGRKIRVSVEDVWGGEMFRRKPTGIRYRIDEARASTATWRGLDLMPRYVMSTKKRGAQGDAKRCLAVVREAAILQIKNERAKRERDRVREKEKDLDASREAKLSEIYPDEIHGVEIRLGRNGKTTLLFSDDWDLLSKIVMVVESHCRISIGTNAGGTNDESD